MRVISVFIFALFAILSCNQKDESESDEGMLWNKNDTIVVWTSEPNKEIKKRLFQPEDSINIPEPLVNGINELWPEAGLFVKGQRIDTLIVGLQNENWLTDEIGNEGAASFLSFAALNLLELKGINRIYFDLTPGVHAGAETWEDSDFADWKEE
jgi:hypothetical protein